MDKSLLTDYFFNERFTKPVSKLGWSIIGPSIEKYAFREPLSYMGITHYNNKKIIYLVNGRPFVLKEVFQSLFQIIPRKLITKEKLNTFLEYEKLQDINYSFIFKHSPSLLLNATRDWNWMPFYHFYKWKKFKNSNNKFYEKYKNKDLTILTNEKLLAEIERLIKRTNSFLKLHRWSFVYSEVFYGLLKGLIRRWIPSIKLDESIEIAENLCSGFSENITAYMDKSLFYLAKSIYNNKIKSKESKSLNFKLSDQIIKYELSDFLDKFGYRAQSLDPSDVTWLEQPEFLIDMIKKYLEMIKKGEIKEFIDKEKRRKETTKFCTKTIRKNSFLLFEPFKILIFKTLLYVSQRFMILREVQRDQWHKIISQKRRVILQISKNLNLHNNEIFNIEYFDLKNLIIKNTNKKTVKKLIRNVKIKKLVKLNNKIINDQKIFKGIGVSMGIVKAKARIINSFSEIKDVKSGEILIARIIDSSWTPVFNLISGLVTEVGGMLSHGSVVAREMSIPAIANIKDATKLIRNGQMIEIDGKKGQLTVIQ